MISRYTSDINIINYNNSNYEDEGGDNSLSSLSSSSSRSGSVVNDMIALGTFNIKRSEEKDVEMNDAQYISEQFCESLLEESEDGASSEETLHGAVPAKSITIRRARNTDGVPDVTNRGRGTVRREGYRREEMNGVEPGWRRQQDDEDSAESSEEEMRDRRMSAVEAYWNRKGMVRGRIGGGRAGNGHRVRGTGLATKQQMDAALQRQELCKANERCYQVFPNGIFGRNTVVKEDSARLGAVDAAIRFTFKDNNNNNPALTWKGIMVEGVLILTDIQEQKVKKLRDGEFSNNVLRVIEFAEETLQCDSVVVAISVREEQDGERGSGAGKAGMMGRAFRYMGFEMVSKRVYDYSKEFMLMGYSI
ncbi:hypothetical protein AX774_g3486 [Zancudomyces culisetae]|uniref:Uncharacterized protein n=1 Tax=Zancudomyces culisetae TaxID=1213189 RepID=A0A1R1PNR7_ZANCU|nr:hypothetical protein AX774_g3903 [Zancudomyces culisetae]OMH83009.1 hypothetical protein AX774_g3486 [Zancudomyces culisetae]|eukprot:OMH82616.1 hypothetical protein AX774_g3903 [Zancudomyces culisetae]